MQIEVGSIVEGKVTGITKYGAFVALPEGKTGMIHISEVSAEFVREIRDFLTENQPVRVKIINIDEGGKIALSLKRARAEEDAKKAAPPVQASASASWSTAQKKRSTTTGDPFEDMMSRFKVESDEKISDLRKSMDAKRASPGFTRKNPGKH
jgi:S1 RNA binding domain protein